MKPNSGIPNFVERAQEGVASAAASGRFDDTRRNRVQRRYSMREVSDLLGFHRSVINGWMDHPDAPKGVFRGRENTLSIYDTLKLRALASTRAKSRRPTLFWRGKDDPLPVIAFSSQKGGTAKSLSAAHCAQFASLYYGLRVGVIDCDPQATISLYFADEDLQFHNLDTETFTRFMGVPAPGGKPLKHADEDLDRFWAKTPWPGVRLMPGGAPIQEADIAMFLMAQEGKGKEKHVYRLLRDTIDRWSAANPPKTTPEDLFDEEGNFLEDRFQSALTETLDLIILDCAPSLTLSQLNAIVAASTLIVPNTLRGFDLSTLKVYLSSLNDYLEYISSTEYPIDFPDLPGLILPTNVAANNDTDGAQVVELYHHDPEVMCPVFYGHSAAVANAALTFQSIYEHEPDRNRKKSADQFTENANAVGDAILSRAIPGLPSRGFANAFLRQKFEGLVPDWTVDDPAAGDGSDQDHKHDNDVDGEEEAA